MNEARQEIEALSYREAMAELEMIVGELEGNELELEESLEEYKRGIELLSSLKRRLDSAEQQITVLLGELEADTDDALHDTTLS